MAGTGRKPYATVDITPFDVPVERLQPPPHLGPAATRVFRDLVARVPAGQFKPSDISLVCRWAEWTAVADRAAGRWPPARWWTSTADRRLGLRSMSAPVSNSLP